MSFVVSLLPAPLSPQITTAWFRRVFWSDEKASSASWKQWGGKLP